MGLARGALQVGQYWQVEEQAFEAEEHGRREATFIGSPPFVADGLLPRQHLGGITKTPMRTHVRDHRGREVRNARGGNDTAVEPH